MVFITPLQKSLNECSFFFSKRRGARASQVLRTSTRTLLRGGRLDGAAADRIAAEDEGLSAHQEVARPRAPTPLDRAGEHRSPRWRSPRLREGTDGLDSRREIHCSTGSGGSVSGGGQRAERRAPKTRTGRPASEPSASAGRVERYRWSSSFCDLLYFLYSLKGFLFDPILFDPVHISLCACSIWRCDTATCKRLQAFTDCDERRIEVSLFFLYIRILPLQLSKFNQHVMHLPVDPFWSTISDEFIYSLKSEFCCRILI